MGRWSLAFRAFFRVLRDTRFAAQVEQADRGFVADRVETVPGGAQPEKRTPKASLPAARSEALTLLAALQREARFVDLVQEPLDNYSDAQIGAAARDVLRDCRGVLQRLFAIEPLVQREEGAPMEVPLGYDAGQFRLTGKVGGQPPFHGRLTHHGWRAAECQLPSWSGSLESARVIAAAEVEVGTS